MRAPVLVAGPADLAVSLEEAKAQLHVSQSDDDMRIQRLIRAATRRYDGPDGILGICVCPQTWRQDFDSFSPCLRIPLGPVISIESVDYTDGDGEPAEIDEEDYSIKHDDEGRCYVEFASGISIDGDFSVTYVAGFEEIPEDLKDAIILRVEARFDLVENTDLLERIADRMAGKYWKALV